jgi:hypothetical protein
LNRAARIRSPGKGSLTAQSRTRASPSRVIWANSGLANWRRCWPTSHPVPDQEQVRENREPSLDSRLLGMRRRSRSSSWVLRSSAISELSSI